ncbi:MAG: FtsX-like permease family protein [Oscillospiraceae bacterium]|nr:FtsX-like permease family protein [Oscillospiraceae bacterium]
MKFESLLARRYISAQKRHSVFTVCSIIIAVALITMLCSCYTTMQGILREACYESQPYHVMFYSVTKNQAAAISHMNQVESVNLIENPDGTYQAQVMFGEYIENHWEYLAKTVRELKLNAVVNYPIEVEGIEVNDELMERDLINLNGRYQLTQSIALLFVFLIFFVLALRLVIDTAFEVSSKEREKQFGVLQCFGATPKQIVRILTIEGMILSAAGVPLGVGSGLLLGYAGYRAVLSSGVAEAYLKNAEIEKIVHFHINPWLTLGGAVIGLGWVFFSAYGTGMRIIKKSPIQAITARSNTVKKVKKRTLLSLLFGWKGKIASRNARRNPKRFAVTVLSLMLSLTMFASVSSIFNVVQENIESAFAMYDSFGKYEVEFSAGFLPDEEKSPTAYETGLKLLDESGYFKNISHYVFTFGSYSEIENPIQVNIFFVNRYNFDRLFSDTPEFSYDALSKTDGCIAVNIPEEVLPADAKTLTVDTFIRRAITEAEYNKGIADPEEAKNYQKWSDVDRNGKKTGETLYYTQKNEPVEYTVAGRFNQPEPPETAIAYIPHDRMLVFTEDQWANGMYSRFGDQLFGTVASFQLINDSDYDAALHWLKEHSDRISFDEEEDNLYAVRKQIRTTLSAVSIGLNFLMLMITLIAVVNMVNIVSTGILNRKQELAAMQCVGMTRGQMYGMTVIECLQFTLWSAIAASIFCALLISCTQTMMATVGLSEVGDKMIMPVGVPIAKVWLASMAVLLCALAASMIPLRRMQEEPLVEQIRAVE